MKALHSLAFLPLFTLAATAGIDSGGGKSIIGSFNNHGSIGSIVASGSSTLGFRRSHSGQVEILYVVPITQALDSDGDNMPDAWERANGLIVGIDDADLDPDGDGATNLMEYLAGTDPQDMNSVSRPSVTYGDGLATIEMSTVPGRNYRLYVSTDLKDWEPWSNFSGDGRTVTFEFDANSVAALNLFTAESMQSVFFRIELSLAP